MARTRAVLMAALLVPFAGLASPALAQASLAMLDTLDRGGWEVRFRDDNSMRKVCIRSGREFIRLRHSGGNCNRFVVEDADRNVTVQYGRTHIRKESPSLVQIDSQGIADGKPFQFTAEARQTGRCN